MDYLWCATLLFKMISFSSSECNPCSKKVDILVSVTLHFALHLQAHEIYILHPVIFQSSSSMNSNLKINQLTSRRPICQRITL